MFNASVFLFTSGQRNIGPFRQSQPLAGCKQRKMYPLTFPPQQMCLEILTLAGEGSIPVLEENKYPDNIQTPGQRVSHPDACIQDCQHSCMSLFCLISAGGETGLRVLSRSELRGVFPTPC